MKITTELYTQSLRENPEQGKHIIGHQSEKSIVVYQAYKPSIAAFALKNQYLGGADFSYSRMSWIKPNFLWMMHRCGWAEKENQERVLALWIDKKELEHILFQGAHTSFNSIHYKNEEEWKTALASSDVRIQWDPDHDPFGNPLSRKAIQIGLKGEVLKKFGQKNIQLIEDITEFVKEQKKHIINKDLDKLHVPMERVYKINNTILKNKIGCE